MQPAVPMKRVSSHSGYLDQYLAGSEPAPASSPTPPIVVPVRAPWSPANSGKRADIEMAPASRHGCSWQAMLYEEQHTRVPSLTFPAY